MAVAALPKLVTKADAAEIFGVCVKSIDNYIAQGLLPRPVPFASKEYWHPDRSVRHCSARYLSTVATRTVSGKTSAKRGHMQIQVRSPT